MAGPGRTRISAAKRARRGQEPPVGEESDQGPHRVADVEAVPQPHGRAGEQVQPVPEGGPLRRRPVQQFHVDQDGAVHAALVQPLRVRLPDGPQPSADRRLGPPEPGGDAAEPGAAGLGDQGVADRCGAVGPPHQQLGRQQDLGDPAVSAAGPPRGHGHRVGSDAADGAGATGPERAQHTPTPRAGHVPRQQDLLGPLGARHDHHGARLHSCRPALPITPRRREGPVGVARGQLSPRAVTKLPTRPRSASARRYRARPTADLGVPLRRRGGDADEPPQGTPGIGIDNDDSPRGHRHPRWCSTNAGVVCIARRTRIPVELMPTDPRARKLRTIDKAQQALALEGKLDYVYGYSYILTNLDVSTPTKLVEVEHWYRHRTDIEALNRDAKHGAALRHLPSGDRTVNTVWMWAALLACAISNWIQEITGIDDRRGRARRTVARMRRELFNIPARVTRTNRAPTLQPPPDAGLLTVVLSRLQNLPTIRAG